MCNLTKASYKEIIDDIARITNSKAREKEIMTKGMELAGLLTLDDADSNPSTASYEAIYHHDNNNVLLGIIGMMMTEKNTQKKESLEHFVVQKIKNLVTQYWIKRIRQDVEQAISDRELYNHYEAGHKDVYQYELLKAFKFPVKFSKPNEG